MKNTFKLFCLSAVLVIGGVSCKKKYDPQIPPECRLESHNFTSYASLSERVTLMPKEVLDAYRKMDNRPDYQAYNPSASDKALVLKYLALLPPIYWKVFEERCAGIYFIENFMGNGIANWAVDRDGKTYFHIALNPSSLRYSLSKTLTEREQSCFIGAPGLSVNVNAGDKYKGLAYALFHEATHAVDYIKRVTPFVEKDFPEKYWPKKSYKGDIFLKSWKDYAVPAKGGNFKGRDRIKFYGLGGGPKLEMKEAPSLYRGLAKSPFISLYGSKNWAEDLAELATFQMITAKLDQPYIITLSGFQKEDIIYKPMSSNRGKRAAEIMKVLESIPVD